ncbi:MAG: sulfotransferase family 2 domain-containing protein [Steroidobacterales bacterium]
MARQLVFVHIPKTGGLSLHAALENIYGRKSTLRAGNEDELQRLRRLPDHQPIDKEFISGHFFYNDIKNRCQPNAILVSILRDPITRILSSYNYITTWSEHPLHEQTMRQSFSEFVCANRDFLRGLCCRHLASVEKADAAIEVVKSRYALVGTTESLPVFVTALSRIIGQKVVQERSNISSGQGPIIDLSVELCQVLLEITEEDRKLLDFVNELPEGLFVGTGSQA